MRVCMILEGSYPIVRGGVSSWMHNYILSLPDVEFVLWVIGPEVKDIGIYKYDLPKNVVEVKQVFLDEALRILVDEKRLLVFSEEENEAHRRLLISDNPDWEILFRIYHNNKININTYLMSEYFLNNLCDILRSDFQHMPMAELFYTFRSILLPALYMISQEIPKADIYHATATGYSGLLGSMASSIDKKPLIITEHGIYCREREEELLRAAWVVPYFKKFWINHFYDLAKIAYKQATIVTSLFARAGDIQHEIGCLRHKQQVIFNGIFTEKFLPIPMKVEDEWIDICAIVRFHPIKDIKTMLYAFFELKCRVSNARLHILGSTDDEQYKKECLDIIEQLSIKDVLIVGVTNVIDYLAKVDFTILTSVSEGQPLSILESFAASRPCVTTDVGCCYEIITGDTIDDFGMAGYIVKPMQVQDLANAMEMMCINKEKRLEMGQNAKKRVLGSFRNEDIMDKYYACYMEVLNGGNRI